jgi:hypothetical protein
MLLLTTISVNGSFSSFPTPLFLFFSPCSISIFERLAHTLYRGMAELCCSGMAVDFHVPFQKQLGGGRLSVVLSLKLASSSLVGAPSCLCLWRGLDSEPFSNYSRIFTPPVFKKFT